MQDNKDKIREKNIDNISKHIADTKIKNKIKKIDKIKRGLIIKKYRCSSRKTRKHKK